MNKARIPPIAIAGVALACLLTSTAAQAALGDLKWLAGCWELDNGEPGSVEIWSTVAGHTMLGMSRRIKDGRTVSWEYVRIVEDDDGIRYIAMPSGQALATFNMVSLNAREVVFENPAHDFPQRVAYRLIDDRRLLASIEGKLGDRQRTVDFPMTRCSGAGSP